MVPTQLHAFWGGPPMPDHLAGWLSQWRELHPSWEFTLWTPETLPPLRSQEFYDHPERWSPKSNVWQHRANLVRYELLYDLGGVWIDCDLEPVRPVDDLVAGDKLVAAWEGDGWVNNCFMAAPAGHLALAEILAGVPASIRNNRHRRSNHQTGARYITPILVARDDVTILGKEMVMPYRWDELHRYAETHPDACMVHHWNNWRRGTAPDA